MHRQQDCQPRRRTTRTVTRVFAASLGLAAFAIFPASCMTRPVAHNIPSLSDSITDNYQQRLIDKIDLLFMIDNSASMGDKQEYLKLAIPDLIDRLVSPNCVDDHDTFMARSTLDSDGNPTCTKGELEFTPVHDMHIGIVSSSLGGHGGDLCIPDPKATGLPAHDDDKGHLITRGGAAEAVIPATQPSNFLAWRPNVAANKDLPLPTGVTAITQIEDLKRDFEDMVAGVGENGCGLEAQLESWYRFLVQPDPYDSIQAGGVLTGVDAALLKQRHDFLRPDSLVAIIDVTDENDSEIDVRSIGGYGQRFVRSTGSWVPAHANATCATSPNDPDCHSCDEDGHGSDPGCTPARYAANSADPQVKADLANLDNVNLRHVHMKQRYGVDPQYPMARYKNGLTQGAVPDRDAEYPAGKRGYVGAGSCTNPLFAASLPDGTDTSVDALCHLPPNPEGGNGRTPKSNLVIYAHIGGVPYQLLVDPKTNAPKALGDSDWDKILGHDPESYDFTGIDPHMIESVTPRAALAAPSSADTSDPIHGREWDTSAVGNNGSDLQYACTFTLPSPKDCTNPATKQGCDCPTQASALPHGQLPPLCDPTTPTSQIKAKTYPTIRELDLAKQMGRQGVVASLCPIHTTDNASHSDPLFGYRPAVASIVDLIKSKLNNQCLPHQVIPAADGTVPCLILETEPDAGPESACGAIPGRRQPDPDVLARFRSDHAASAQFPVCEVVQLLGADLADGTCRHATAPGWCYVSGEAAGDCEQSILFSPAGNPQSKATLTLQCFESIPAPHE